MKHARLTPGFTLIEFLGVLTLSALILAIAAATLTNPLRAATHQKLVTTITDYDRDTRTLARRTNRPLRLVIDLDKQQIARVDPGENNEAAGQPLRLDKGWQIQSVVVDGNELEQGRVALPCSNMGTMPTHALKFSGPENEGFWLLSIGISGQITEYEAEDEKAIQDVFEALQRRDAD